MVHTSQVLCNYGFGTRSVATYHPPAMKKIMALKRLNDYRIWLRFDDGVEGEVDFSQKPRTGVYALWQDYEFFRRARIGEYAELRWDDQLDFGPDSLWLRVTGRQPEELATDFQPARTHA